MKRSWFGFLLLVLLLIASILSSGSMVEIHEPVADKLHQAARYAMDDHWESASSLFLEAEKDWKHHEKIRSCFADHTPVEEIDAGFEVLNVFCTARETVSFSGGCHSLARQITAVGEAHKMVWWNFF